jgi:hypothetical protein
MQESHIGEVSVHLEEGEVCGDGEILRRLGHLLQLRIHRLNKGTISRFRIKSNAVKNSFGDTEPDPHAFGPPGLRSISQRFWLQIQTFPFTHKGVERTEIMLTK